MVDFAERLEAKKCEEIWEKICAVCADYAGITAEQVEALLAAEAGMTAYDHHGIFAAVEAALWFSNSPDYDEIMTRLLSRG